MGKKYFFSTIFFLILFCKLVNAQPNGEKLFSQKCTVCHTIGEGKRVGPDLANIHNRRAEDWLINFIRSSQTLINSGDSLAVSVFEENNRVVMPDQPLSELETKAIIDYIVLNSPDPDNPNIKTPKQIFDATGITQVDIKRGMELFEGSKKFANGGPPCIVCHSVQVPGIFDGGKLSVDLSKAFSRLSPAGIDAVLRSPPFPAMINSFGEKSLTDQEIKDLIAFLYQTDNIDSSKDYSEMGNVVFLVVIIFGLNFIILILLVNWLRVKKRSVFPTY